MELSKYIPINTEEQYWDYCTDLEELVMRESNDPKVVEEIDLLTGLIEKWGQKHNTLGESDPVEILKYLMEENKIVVRFVKY
jgi:HTH-type transcriptional regulator/antitoxin HigA